MSGRTMHGLAIFAIAATMQVSAAQAQPAKSVSVFATAPDDPAAVTVKAKGDGATDDSAAIQAAIDTASLKPGGGIVFLPSGRYRITRTLFMWPGVRLFGTGTLPRSGTPPGPGAPPLGWLPVKKTMLPTPRWKPGVFGASTNIGRVLPTPNSRTPGHI